MQLPTVLRPTIALPPMYTWPRLIKRIVFVFAVILVTAAYLLLAGGIVAGLILLLQGINY
jgi:hypothetical protein